MEPNTQSGSPTEQPITPDVAMNAVPDAIEPDTSSTNVIQPAPPVDMAPSVAEPASASVSFSLTPAPVVALATPPPAKKKTTLILIVVLGALVLAAAAVIIYVTTMS